MGAESAEPATTPTGAVFLSYASQDAEAAQKICDALRAAGIEAWFDQSELKGGDAWDQKIRRQIRDCALFIPIISANTTARHEGYFRLEWDLADQRTHMMARDRAFIVPVCLDATPAAGTDVPESFHRVQWTRLSGGETSPAFVERVRRLLSPEAPPARGATTLSGSTSLPISPSSVRQPWRFKAGLWVTGAVIAVTLAGIAIDRFLLSRRSPPPTLRAPPAAQPPAPAPATTADFNPPPHSIAVLPFVNMSGDKEQEYFSDGLSEELLNDLSRIDELQVAARTSAFSFKGKDTDISTIARKLNVGAVLEGSVRRSGNTVRITTQLINAVTGFRTWSQTYDRNLTDMLKLQTEIADAVVKALKVNLLGDITAKVEVGGTRNPAAFDAYLRGFKAFYEGMISRGPSDREGKQTASKFFSEAIRLDPAYALAYMARAESYSAYGEEYATTASIRDGFLNRALVDARKSVKLAPNLGEGYGALGMVLEDRLEFDSARKAFDSSRALAGGSARVWRNYSRFYSHMGFADEAVTAARHAVTLDPLNALSYCRLGDRFQTVRRYDEALVAYDECEALSARSAPGLGNSRPPVSRGFVRYEMGDYSVAQASCEAGDRTWRNTQECLALVYDKLGRHADAEAELKKLQTAYENAAAYQYAAIYAQWGDRPKALEWLDTAMRLRDPALGYLKTDPLLDPLRKEPRFQAIERALKFPN